METPAPPSIGWELLPTIPPAWKGTWPLLSREEKYLLTHALEKIYSANETQPEQALLPSLEQGARERGWVLNTHQSRYLQDILHQHTQGAGALTPLLNRPAIEEVAITGIGKNHPVRVYDATKGWMDTPLYFDDTNILISLLNRLARESGERLSGENPILNARIQGGMRLHASLFPISHSPIEASIRRFTHQPTSPRELLPSRVWDPEIVAYLEHALTCDANVMIAGNTGSGKTTTLNALTHVFPAQERIITIEETPELSLAHPHRVSLSPKKGTPYDLPRLIRETLRMRPDRVIVGEVRFPEEARALMESILSGQGKGTYTTFHGHSALETIARLRQYGVLEQDLSWIDVVVIQRRWTQMDEHAKPTPVRKITEVVELEYDVHTGLHARPIFVYNPQADDWNAFPSVRIAEKFPLYFPHSSWEKSLRERARMLAGGNHAPRRPPFIHAAAKGPAVGVRH